MYVAVPAIVSCTMLTDLATKAIMPDKGGGINTELVVGDKEQTLGNNLDIKAKSVETVVGNNDNSTDVKQAEEVHITNVNVPTWLVVTLFVGFVLALMAPTPTRMWNWFTRKKE